MNEQQLQSASRNIVKKITVKEVLGGKPDIAKLIDFNKAHGETATMPVMGIVGIASDFLPGRTVLPDGKEQSWLKLLGQFKATNLETGEVFVSGAAILPGAGNDLVYGALKSVAEQGGTVSFVFRIGLKRDKASATGYVYVVEQVYQPEAADPLAALEARLVPVAAIEQEKIAQIGGKKK